MLIVDMNAVKLPSEAKQNNLPPECGQPIDVGDTVIIAIQALVFEASDLQDHHSPKLG
jgi:hypothetical protein